MIFIIGGKAGSGKSELAKIIKKHYEKKGKKSVITEYSKYLKLYAKEMINWDYKEPKPRKFLQDIGQYVRKDIDNKFLIDRMKQDILVYQKYFDVIIISDARFIDELEDIRNEYPDTYTIHLINNSENNLNVKEKNHISELALDNYMGFDYTIRINTIEELNKEIEIVLEVIK